MPDLNSKVRHSSPAVTRSDSFIQDLRLTLQYPFAGFPGGSDLIEITSDVCIICIHRNLIIFHSCHSRPKFMNLSVFLQDLQPLIQISPKDLLHLLKVMFPVQVIKNGCQFFFAMFPNEYCHRFHCVCIISTCIESCPAVS